MEIFFVHVLNFPPPKRPLLRPPPPPPPKPHFFAGLMPPKKLRPHCAAWLDDAIWTATDPRTSLGYNANSQMIFACAVLDPAVKGCRTAPEPEDEAEEGPLGDAWVAPKGVDQGTLLWIGPRRGWGWGGGLNVDQGPETAGKGRRHQGHRGR